MTSLTDTEKQEIMEEARKRFARAESWEAQSRMLEAVDEKFGNADSDHPDWQWLDVDYKNRTNPTENAPCLVINKTRQHCLQIINDMRQHEDGVQVRPVGGGATFAAAQVYEGLVRHVEYISNATQAYDTGVWNQVFAGIGYWRIVTEFANEDSFDTEIFIRRIANRNSVYLDCDIKEYDGSDANWGFIFDDMPREEAIAQGLIDKDDIAPNSTLGSGTGSWVTQDHVRVAEYFRRTNKEDELIELPPELAQMLGTPTARKSELPKELRDAIPKDLRHRKILTPEVQWIKIVGNEIKKCEPWAGKYIPIIRIIGEETVIDGILDRKGHVRALKDPQRMYNYNSSASVQYGALQSKASWMASMESVGPYGEYWAHVNTRPPAWLPWQAKDEAGNANPEPRRIEPPVAAPVFIEGLKIAQQELMLASGQYQAIMGAPSNETSGVAINARQRQGDNATGHYLQHRATAIRFTGKQLIDLFPKIYDTARVVQIIARDGKRNAVQIDPDAKTAHEPTMDESDMEDADDSAITAIFNPAVGQYDVMADVGPSFATARQEAFNAFSQIIQHNPDLVHVVGDLMFRAADFPMADEIADRLRRMVPDQATGGPSKEMQALQQHVQQAAQAGQAQIEQLHEALQAANKKLDDQSRDMERKDYEAETNRLRAVGGIDPEALRPVIRSLVSEVLGTPIVPVMQAHAAALAPPPDPNMPQQPDVTQGAPDGQ